MSKRGEGRGGSKKENWDRSNTGQKQGGLHKERKPGSSRNTDFELAPGGKRSKEGEVRRSRRLRVGAKNFTLKEKYRVEEKASRLPKLRA